MGQVFPYEVGKLGKRELPHYGEFIRIEAQDIPDCIEFYVDKEVINELPDEVIIDYLRIGEVDLCFIPPIPEPIENYELYVSD